jgi:hypothetical protein
MQNLVLIAVMLTNIPDDITYGRFTSARALFAIELALCVSVTWLQANVVYMHKTIMVAKLRRKFGQFIFQLSWESSSSAMVSTT